MKIKLSLFVLCTFLLFACSKKGSEPELTLDSAVSTHYDKTHQFTVKQGSAAAGGFTWSSSDTQVGTVNTSGLFTAKRVGKTTIRAEKGGRILQSEVTVTPYFNTFKEPVTEFGLSRAGVKSKETRLALGETTDALTYSGEHAKVRGLVYLFEGTGLAAGVVLFANTTDMVNEALTFYNERYNFLGTDSDGRYYQHGKVALILNVDATLGFNAIYIPYDGPGSISAIKSAARTVPHDVRIMKQF